MKQREGEEQRKEGVRGRGMKGKGGGRREEEKMEEGGRGRGEEGRGR